MGIINLIALPLLALALPVTLGQSSRRLPKYGWLATAVALLFVLLPPVFHEVFRLPFWTISVIGFVAGRFVLVSDKAMRRWYLTAHFAAFGIALSDLLYGARQSGFIIDCLAGSVVTAVVALFLYVIACFIMRACRSDGSRPIFWLFVVCAIITYAVEPHLHGTIQHRYWTHHPFVTFATIGGLVIGYLAGRSAVLPTYRPISPDGPALAIASYFFIYHLVIDAEEGTSGPGPYSSIYGWLMLLTLTVTLPFGVLLGILWGRDYDKQHPMAKLPPEHDAIEKGANMHCSEPGGGVAVAIVASRPRGR